MSNSLVVIPAGLPAATRWRHTVFLSPSPGPGALTGTGRLGLAPVVATFSTYKSPKFYLSFIILVSFTLVKYPDRIGLVNTYGTVQAGTGTLPYLRRTASRIILPLEPWYACASLYAVCSFCYRSYGRPVAATSGVIVVRGAAAPGRLYLFITALTALLLARSRQAGKP